MTRLAILLVLCLSALSCKSMAEEWWRVLRDNSDPPAASGPQFTNIEVNELADIMPVLRYRHHIDVKKGSLGEGVELHVELGTQYVDEEFKLGLGPGETTQVDSKILSGTLAGDVTLMENTLAVALRQKVDEWLDTDFLFGVGYHRVELELRSPTTTARDRFDTGGPMIGGALQARMNDWLQLHARATFMLLPASSSSTQMEVGLKFRMEEHVDFLFGYRYWNYHHDHGPVEYDIDLHGLMAGFELHFTP